MFWAYFEASCLLFLISSATRCCLYNCFILFSACRQPELGHSAFTCLQVGRLLGEPAHSFTGCLCRACICMAASRAAAGAGIEGEEVLLMFTDPVRRTWWTGLQWCLACGDVTKNSMRSLNTWIDMQYTLTYMCVWVDFHIPTHINENKRTQHFCSPTEKQLHVELSIFVSLAANFLITHPVFVTALLPPPHHLSVILYQTSAEAELEAHLLQLLLKTHL